MTDLNQFESFGKIERYSKAHVIVTEKIDGTNAQIVVTSEGEVKAGSRNRWITPDADNFGFARWVKEHEDELRRLGPGRHFGEWWGLGIQRGYGLKEKRFSLFNTHRFAGTNPPPPCCSVVPILWEGGLANYSAASAIERLRTEGSVAAPGFMQPEGVIVYIVHSKVMFKHLLENDTLHKWETPQ